MANILFYDKQIYWNCPDYAVDFLKKLREKNHKIFVIYGNWNDKEDMKAFEKSTGFKFKQIYQGFDSKAIHSLRDLKIVVSYFQPDIYISNFSIRGFERDILRFIKKNGKIKIIELDNVASEIMLYNKLHFLYLFRILPNSLISYLKKFFRKYFYYLIIGDKSILNSESLKLHADFLCLKGQFFKDYLLKFQDMQIHSHKILVTGSLQLEYIRNSKAVQKSFFDKYGLDINKPLIIVMPNPIKTYLKNVSFNFIDCCLEQITNSGKYNILLNLHPSDRFRGINQYSHHDVKIIQNGDLYPLLKFSLAAISSRSTIGLETSYAEVPILIDENDAGILDFPYLEKGNRVGLAVNSNNISETLCKVENGYYSFDFTNFNRYYSIGKNQNSVDEIIRIVDSV